MNEEDRFCVACGAKLPEGAAFCTECGAAVDGTRNPHFAEPAYRRDPRTAKDGPDMKVFIVIYGILALVLALMFIGTGLILDEELWNQMNDMYADMGISFGEWDPAYQMEMLIPGVFTLLSGVFALVSYWYCRKLGPRKTAVIMCGLSSVLILGAFQGYGYFTILLFAIGLFVTYRLYNDRYGFTS